jgi:hypothetical protein
VGGPKRVGGKVAQFIPFPFDYIKDLQDGKKCLTLRIQDELGKYYENETYIATTYGGDLIGVKIRVLRVERIEVVSPGIRLDKTRKGDKGIRHVGPADMVWFSTR